MLDNSQKCSESSEMSKKLVTSALLLQLDSALSIFLQRGKQCQALNVSQVLLLKVSPDWICAVTSRFTKLFYCEGANIAHIQSGVTLVRVVIMVILI